jgi:hypothetical protein
MGKSYSSTVTDIADDRLITGEGSIGVTGRGNTLSVSDSRSYTDASTTILSDQGAIASAADSVRASLGTVERSLGTVERSNASAADIVRASLGTVENSNVIAGEGFAKVLDLAGSLFSKNFTALETSQAGVASAYQTAQELKGSALDSKTIVLLAAAGVVLVLIIMNKGRA